MGRGSKEGRQWICEIGRDAIHHWKCNSEGVATALHAACRISSDKRWVGRNAQSLTWVGDGDLHVETHDNRRGTLKPVR